MAITATQIYTLGAQFAQDEGFNTNSTTEYLAACNEAHRRLAEILKANVSTSMLSSVGGTQSYSLPSDYMAMYDNYSTKYGPVSYTDSTGQVHYPVFTDFQTVRNIIKTGLYTDTGTPTYCWADVKNKLWLYPTPDYSATDNIGIEYYNYPTELTATDNSDYPNKYLYVLAYLTASVIAELNELDADVVKFHSKAVIRLNSLSNAGDRLNTNNNNSKIAYLG